MRVFFGIEPDSATRLAIADWRDRFGLAAGRPVPVANFHITLAFIGVVSSRHVETLCDAVDAREGATEFVGGRLDLDQVGFWPGPGIYWMGTSEPARQVADLAHKLAHLGGLVGARRKRKTYTPHVTLYRDCNEPPPVPVSPPDIKLVYDHFTLFESRQGRQSVSYHALAQWGLTA